MGKKTVHSPFNRKSMAKEHPFQTLFETLGRLPSAHADSVNRQAYQALYDVLSVPLEKTGRCILLRAPRAGHGKTHMLSRMQHHLGASHEFIALHAGPGSRIDAASVTDDTLRRLLRPLPAAGGLCVLDLLTRRLFSLALQPLVASGEVPCQDREGALMALRTRPVETFDFHHPNAVTAHWARENFEVLGQRLSMEISQRGGLPVREVSFWVDTMFHFAATPVDHSSRMRALADAIHEGDPTEGVRMDRLIALLGMVAMLVRVVLVADDLEGFSSNEAAALGLAAFLGSLRQSVDRLDVILSLNQDVWDSAFVPRLTGGLRDRLSEVLIELAPLNEMEMLALLESRVPGLGSRVLERVNRNSAGTHARGVIRAAGVAWVKASEAPAAPQVGYPPEVPAVSSVVVPPHFVGEMVKPAPVPVVEPVVVPSDEPPVPEVEVEEIPTVESIVPSAIPAEVDEAQVPEEIETTVPPPEPVEVAPEIAEVESAAAIESPPDEPVTVAEERPMPEPSPFSVAPPIEEPITPPEQMVVPASPAPVAEPEPTPVPDAPAPAVFPTVFAPSPDHMAPVEPAFQAVPEASVFQAAPAAPPSVEPPTIGPPPEPLRPTAAPVQAAAQPQAQAQDTDRVDELLRQFRERYGRGNG